MSKLIVIFKRKLSLQRLYHIRREAYGIMKKYIKWEKEQCNTRKVGKMTENRNCWKMRLQFKKSENYLKHNANLDDLGNFLINTIYQNWLKEKWKSWIDSYPTVISVLKSTCIVLDRGYDGGGPSSKHGRQREKECLSRPCF